MKPLCIVLMKPSNSGFYFLHDKVYRESILEHVYKLAKANRGAPRVTAQIEEAGVEEWLSGLRQEPVRYKPQPAALMQSAA